MPPASPAITSPSYAVPCWGAERLRASGLALALAPTIADDRGYGFHALLELIDRGRLGVRTSRISSPLDRSVALC